MNDNSGLAFVIGLVSGLAILVLTMEFFPQYSVPYKRGQIDALNGKVLFELKQQPDGTTQWIRKP